MIINLRKLILKLASPKLKEFLLHTHPLAYIPKSHVSFNYKGPNYCNYITECMVYAYTHGVSGIATDEIPGDKVLLLKLKELLAKKFNLQLDLTQVIKNDGQYLGFSCFKSLHGFKFMNIN